MSKARKMQERDRRMFGDKVRDHIYAGNDYSYTSDADITAAEARDHGARILLGKFSSFNLSRLTPEQRKVFVEQMKHDIQLAGDDLNKYLSDRYSPEDMHEIWLMRQKANGHRKRQLGLTVKNKGRKRAISNKQRRKLTPEEAAARTAKAKATRERNKKDPNYVSYATLKREFMKLQKLLADRNETRMKQAVELFAEPIVARKVRRRTAKTEAENQRLKEYLRQNNLPLPGTARDKKRREQLRAED